MLFWAVPEPSTDLLIGMVLTAITYIRDRRIGLARDAGIS